MNLRPCSTCRRHVRSSEECPFCAKTSRAPSVGFAAALAAMSLVACAKDPAPIAPDASGAPVEKPAANAGTPPTTPAPEPTMTTPPAPQPTPAVVATTAPSATGTPVTTATPVTTTKPPAPTPRPDRPVMARYGVAPDFR
jgi:hypothetical protein